MKKIKLKNNVSLVIKNNKKTPRIAFSLMFELKNQEFKAGVYTLLKRLFFQGTKSKTAQQLAQELEQNAIECSCHLKNDYLQFSLLTLNENFEEGVEILADIIKNSTFADLEKEIYKIKGEYEAELDSPKTRALDDYIKMIFGGHFYGNSYTKVLDSIDEIKLKDIKEAYDELMMNSYKTMIVVGDINENEIKNIIEKYLGFLTTIDLNKNPVVSLTLTEKKVSTIAKEDAQQAQIIKGWLVPSVYSSDAAAFVVMNNILGASGLSSRLFLELRDKKGLAYTVRSNYETYKQAAHFNVYIGTEPSNIQTALEGFEYEINRLKEKLVTDEELENAKNNIIGKRLFFTETNINQSMIIGKFDVFGLGYDYEAEFVENIKKVTKENIKNVAKNYLDEHYVLTILAPQKNLDLLKG